jgi:hypothetical protein
MSEFKTFLKYVGYDIDRDHVDIDKIFPEEGYNPFLSKKEDTDLYFYAQGWRESYIKWATEHYMICKYRHCDFYRFGRTDLEIDARFYELAKFMEWAAEEVAIADRKRYLNRVARQDLKNSNNNTSAQLAMALNSKAELSQSAIQFPQ